MSSTAEDQNGAIQKRTRDEAEAGGGDDAGPAKKLKTEEIAGAGAGGGVNAEGAAVAEHAGDDIEIEPIGEAQPDAGKAPDAHFDEVMKAEETKDADQGASKAADEPKKVGYKLFKDGREAASYFRHLLTCLTPHQDLNEYEFHMVLELLKHGHPEPSKKIGPGVNAIQVQPHKDHEDSNCFYLKRVDGTVEDFSASKCINSLFPAFGELRGVMHQEKDNNMRGRGRGGRGRGGRGRGRGSRGGRGRGGRGG
ncbi:probable protein EMBRYO DEFECTIVE 514 at C-terminar half [Coccomyxa sp. Obi]|nr:probable protein EMBRYO DEFECTIVE 514 at C-terminar half [Coccomyxa sp. Obi]